MRCSELLRARPVKLGIRLLAVCILLGLTPARAEQPGNRLPTAAETALTRATSATLFSVEPHEKPGATDKTLYGFKVLGSAALTPQATVTAVTEFRKSVHDFNGDQAACFYPRHALRVTAPDATYDFLLCYECGYIDIYRATHRIARLGAGGSSATLDKLLQELGLPRAKPLK